MCDIESVFPGGKKNVEKKKIKDDVNDKQRKCDYYISLENNLHTHLSNDLVTWVLFYFHPRFSLFFSLHSAYLHVLKRAARYQWGPDFSKWDFESSN